MSETRAFDINCSGNIIHTINRGEWGVGTDLSYLTRMSTCIEEMRGRPWGMLVNMLDWDMEDVAKNPQDKQTAAIYLDRRNQVGECWIVKNDQQANSLLKYVQNRPNLQFQRFCTEAEGWHWLQTLGLKK